MAATAPPEESLSSGESGQVRPQSFPQPQQQQLGYPQQQQLCYPQQQVGYPQQQVGYPQQQQGFAVTSGSYPLQPYPNQLVFCEPTANARSSLQPFQTLVVRPTSHGPVQIVVPSRVAPPYQPPPPYPQYGATHPSPAQPSTPAPSRPTPQTSPSDNQCCYKIIKTLITLAIISLIVSLCYYFFYLKKKH